MLLFNVTLPFSYQEVGPKCPLWTWPVWLTFTQQKVAEVMLHDFQIKLPPSRWLFFSFSPGLCAYSWEREGHALLPSSLKKLGFWMLSLSTPFLSGSATPWTTAHQASLSFISQSLFKLISVELLMSSNHLILCRPLLLPSIFPASGSFLMSLLFTSDSQSIGASASASVLPVNIQDWFPLGLTGLISLQSKGHSRVFSSTTVWKHPLFGAQPSLWSNSHIHTQLLENP